MIFLPSMNNLINNILQLAVHKYSYCTEPKTLKFLWWCTIYYETFEAKNFPASCTRIPSRKNFHGLLILSLKSIYGVWRVPSWTFIQKSFADMQKSQKPWNFSVSKLSVASLCQLGPFSLAQSHLLELPRYMVLVKQLQRTLCSS